MKITRYMAIAAALLPLFTSCSKSSHPEDFGLAVSAVWENESDRGTEVKRERLWIYTVDGQPLMSGDWTDPRELGNSLFPLQTGDYIVALGVNMEPPFGIDGAEATADALTMTLEAGTSPFHAYSYATEVHISDRSMVTTAFMTERRVLSEFALEISEIPEGTRVDLAVINSADAFFPVRRNVDGRFGVISDRIREVQFPDLKLDAQSFRSDNMKVMPTAYGREYSFFTLTMTTPTGQIIESYIEAPRMDSSGKYLMSLKYSEICSFMHLSSCVIRDWTEGWVYSGVILDPTE